MVRLPRSAAQLGPALLLFALGCDATPEARQPSEPGPPAAPASIASPTWEHDAPADRGELVGRGKPSARTACLAAPVHYEQPELEPGPVDPALAAELDHCPYAASPPECRYGVAQRYFTAKHYELAEPLFRDLAFDPASKDLSIYSAQLELECLNVLGTHAKPARPECFELMEHDVPALQGTLCTPEPVNGAAEVCGILRQITIDLHRLQAEQWVKEADRDPPNARSLYGRAGDAYEAMFETYCRPAARPGPTTAAPRSVHCDELLFNATRAYRAAGQLDKADHARAELLDPRNGLYRSPLAQKLAGSGPP
jgi:hypothetical protein